MRTPVIAGNWKLYKTSAEAIELLRSLMPRLQDMTDVEIIIAPVFTVLWPVKKALGNASIQLAAQDCFWEEEGAFTGEVSPKMLVDAGCTHVIIGHSERRQYFGETDETVNWKLLAALKGGLIPIFCIGETLDERESAETFTVLRKQIAGGLTGIAAEEVEKIIIAYEPVWAIGTGKTATAGQAQEAHRFIRMLISELYGESVSGKIRILYGGSVKPENAGEILIQPDIDGALVGGASLNADSFASIAGSLDFKN
jgi:triosephosphate isomerase